MKCVVIGTDANGKSCVTVEHELPGSGFDKFETRSLWTTDHLPPRMAVVRDASSDNTITLTPTADGSVFMLGVLPPGHVSPVHRTDTLDYGVVTKGDIRLVLEAGEAQLGEGDCYILPGLTHHSIAGPNGAVMAVALLGLGLAEPT